MLEDLGNCVKIHDTVIPAVNIQVEGFPKFVGDVWYGIYFEILFEDGTLWEVEQRHQDLPVLIIIYPRWGLNFKLFSVLCERDNWEEFLRLYNLNLFVRDKTRQYHWFAYHEWMAA